MLNMRDLPSVDVLLNTDTGLECIASYGHALTVAAIRQVLDDVRSSSSVLEKIPTPDEILDNTQLQLKKWVLPTLRQVINATGVIIHTNLGRAPLSQDAIQAIRSIGVGYSTLEYDIEKGQRGSRLVHTEAMLIYLTGAEAALVVNNNAAAILLILTTFARRKRVVIARSQLVEIGGGFRIPDVMKQSGARLVEVGATNRVHLRDYDEAFHEPIAVILRAHRSNFKMTGFVQEPDVQSLVELAHARKVLAVDDLGSGTLLETESFGLEHEPTVQESLSAGMDLVCFSGDKLLGGPQAGIIAGRAELVQKLKKHPLARAVRADKLCLAGLSATLTHYLKNEADKKIPVWQMISAPVKSLEARVKNWRAVLGKGEVIEGRSTVGGGSLPEETLPSYLFALNVQHPGKCLENLRNSNPPVIARIESGRVICDPRTVLPDQDADLLVSLARII